MPKATAFSRNARVVEGGLFARAHGIARRQRADAILLEQLEDVGALRVQRVDLPKGAEVYHNDRTTWAIFV